jgi:hypothetical protein
MSDPITRIQKIGEGRLQKIDEKIQSYIKEPKAPWQRYIVLEVISDPYLIDDNKYDYYNKILKVTNIRFAKILPRNTIIAQPAYVGNFSSHVFVSIFPITPCNAL